MSLSTKSEDMLGKVSVMAVMLHEVLDGYDRGRGAWPSVQTLADRLGVSRPTVYKARRELIEAGYIKVEKVGRGDRYVFPRDGL